MRRLIVAVLLAITGLAAGGATALFWLKQPSAGGNVTVGAWRADLSAGDPAADMFSRARIALNGLLALNRSETIYFVASQDDAGQALNGICQYTISGMPPAARWWSITLYGDDLFLIANPANRFSFNQANVARDGGGAFSIAVAASPQPGNWLPAPSARNFILVLRLYNPAPALAQNPAGLPAPRIARGPCTVAAQGKP
jgi:hypothetical protein